MAADGDDEASPANRMLNPLLQRLPHLLVQSDESATPSESRDSKRPSQQNGTISVVGAGLESNQITPHRKCRRERFKHPLKNAAYERSGRLAGGGGGAGGGGRDRSELKHNAHMSEVRREQIDVSLVEEQRVFQADERRGEAEENRRRST